MDFINFLKVSALCKLKGLLAGGLAWGVIAGGLAWGVIARGVVKALGVKALRVIKARGGVIGARGIVALKVIARAGVAADLNCSYVIGVKLMLNCAIA
jgi:hypothetical protein